MGKKKKRITGGGLSEDGVDDDAVESLREALGGTLNAKVIAQELRAAQGDTDRALDALLLLLTQAPLPPSPLLSHCSSASSASTTSDPPGVPLPPPLAPVPVSSQPSPPLSPPRPPLPTSHAEWEADVADAMYEPKAVRVVEGEEDGLGEEEAWLLLCEGLQGLLDLEQLAQLFQDCEGDLGVCLEEAHAQLQGSEQDYHTQEEEEDPTWSSLLLLKAVLPDHDEASLLQALHSHQGDAQAAAQQLLYQHDNPPLSVVPPPRVSSPWAAPHAVKALLPPSSLFPPSSSSATSDFPALPTSPSPHYSTPTRVKKGPSSASGGSTPLSYHGLARTQTKGQTKGQAGGGGGGSLKLLWLTRRFSPHFHHELLQQLYEEHGGDVEVVECCLLERDALAYHSALARHEQRHVTQQLLTSFRLPSSDEALGAGGSEAGITRPHPHSAPATPRGGSSGPGFASPSRPKAPGSATRDTATRRSGLGGESWSVEGEASHYRAEASAARVSLLQHVATSAALCRLPHGRQAAAVLWSSRSASHRRVLNSANAKAAQAILAQQCPILLTQRDEELGLVNVTGLRTQDVAVYCEGEGPSRWLPLDLHGLQVKEAIQVLCSLLEVLSQRPLPVSCGVRGLRLIVGRGLHSHKHKARLAPALASLLQRKGVPFEAQESRGLIDVPLAKARR